MQTQKERGSLVGNVLDGGTWIIQTDSMVSKTFHIRTYVLYVYVLHCANQCMLACKRIHITIIYHKARHNSSSTTRICGFHSRNLQGVLTVVILIYTQRMQRNGALYLTRRHKRMTIKTLTVTPMNVRMYVNSTSG